MPILSNRFRWIFAMGVVVVGFGGALFQILSSTHAAPPTASRTTAPNSDNQTLPNDGPSEATRVATVAPRSGGAARTVAVPCAAHWYESADLYAKVAGYLDQLDVDIGSRVKVGEKLAIIDVPELEDDVILADAALLYQHSAVKQFDARKKSAMAEHRAAEAACLKAEADVERWTAEELFRQKEYNRLSALSQTSSVQAALVDEKLFQLQSVQAGKHSAETSVLTAKEQAGAAGARVELADADLVVAKMQTKIEEAKLNKAKRLASFAQVISPYDGVVTARHYHRGEFIEAAGKSSNLPIISVGRTDLIRVVVHIPDYDVPYTNAGDPVTIKFDTLPAHSFTGKLARIAHSEDIKTRTMRAEVDLPNEKGLIVDQMYGQMRIELEVAGDTLTLPATCLVGNLKNGQGTIFIVRDGLAKLQTVGIGQHDGIRVEILRGLNSQDQVVNRPPASLTDGMSVSVEATTPTT